MSALSLGAAFGAGVLTMLSPCVLPMLPIVLGAAHAEHRYGAAALASGAALSFTAVGLFIATIGFALGISDRAFTRAAGLLLVVFGFVLLTPRVQGALEAGLGPISRRASARISRVGASGVWGQFGLGALLGAIWSPCVGPTLGAASLLASQGKSIGLVTAAMGLFGLGAAAPLLLIGSLSRTTLIRWRPRMGAAGRFGKLALGSGMVAAGALAVSGWDRTLEAWLVDLSPAWLTRLTTSI